MAQSLTYNNKAVVEDVLSYITNLYPTETQLTTGLGKSKAEQPVHQWLVDGYDTLTDTSNDKKAVEGADYGAGDVTNPTRKTNYTQIIVQDWKVSGTEEASKHAGMTSPKAYHSAKAMVNWKHKLEWALLHGVANAGNATAAREMGGIFDQITTNKVANLNNNLTEALLNDYFQKVWDTSQAASGNADAVYVGARGKRTISSFTAGNTRNIEAKDRRLVNAVDVYESDFGIVKIFKHRFINSVKTDADTGNLLVLTEATWKIAYLREPKNMDAPKGGDYEKGAIVGEATLEGLYEAANMAVKGIKNA